VTGVRTPHPAGGASTMDDAWAALVKEAEELHFDQNQLNNAWEEEPRALGRRTPAVLQGIEPNALSG